MAIIKQYLNLNLNSATSFEELSNYLRDALVTNLNIVEDVIYDAQIPKQIKIVSNGIEFFINGHDSGGIDNFQNICLNDQSTKTIQKNRTYLAYAQYLYITSTSAMLLFSEGTGMRYQCPVIFTKTNNEKLMIFIHGNMQDTSSTQDYPDSGYLCYSGDDYTVQSNPLVLKTIRHEIGANQIQIVPFLANPQIGTKSYTPNAYIATCSNIVLNNYGGWETYILDGSYYLTNGSLWIKDDKV